MWENSLTGIVHDVEFARDVMRLPVSAAATMPESPSSALRLPTALSNTVSIF